MPNNILITGGTGLVGSKLIPQLQKQGHQISLLSRSGGFREGIKAYKWDYHNNYIEPGAFDGIDTIIHLAGAGVAEEKWSKNRKEEILNSRTKTSHLLFETVRKGSYPVKNLIAASAIGYYGLDTGNTIIKEGAPVGHDFLAHVVDAWETSTKKFEQLGVRVVQLRIGVVLSQKGGALQKLLEPPVAAPLASGKQYMSWIHIDDLVGIISKSAEDEKFKGIYNAVAPKPATNRELTKMAAKAYGKTFVPIPVPKLMLKLILGEMAGIVIGGNRVSSEKIMEQGYSFKFPKLEPALTNLAAR